MNTQEKKLIIDTLSGQVARVENFWERFPPENSFDKAQKELSVERAKFIDDAISNNDFSAFTIEKCGSDVQIFVTYPNDGPILMASTPDARDIEGY